MTKQTIKLYDCPVCNRKFQRDQVKTGRCPHCNAPIKAVQNKIDSRISTEYVSNTEQRRMLEPDIKIPEDQSEYGKLITPGGQVPEVWLRVKERKYTVIYRGGVINIGWEYCPECAQKVFENVVMNGWLDQNHVCRKCKAKIRYIYKS